MLSYDTSDPPTPPLLSRATDEQLGAKHSEQAMGKSKMGSNSSDSSGSSDNARDGRDDRFASTSIRFSAVRYSISIGLAARRGGSTDEDNTNIFVGAKSFSYGDVL